MQNFCFQSQITLLKVEDFAYSSRKQRWNSQLNPEHRAKVKNDSLRLPCRLAQAAPVLADYAV